MGVQHILTGVGGKNMLHAFIEKSEVATKFVVGIPANLSIHDT
jgi:hypothetical protein